jgi:hypothetical protein
MNIEDDLRAALRHEAAPPDFAAKVLARTRVVPMWRRPAVLAMAAALVVAAVVPAGYQYRRQQDRQQRAIEAKDQLVLALSITRVQLQRTTERIRQNTRNR